MSPQLRLKCAQGRDYLYLYLYLYIYIAGTGSSVHEPIHHIFCSFVGQHRKMGCCPPALYRSFTSIQMVHTHAPPQQGRWNENESEMTMKMKWNLLNQNAKRGTQKKRDRENTNTTHLARNGQTLKRQGKRKAEADGQRNKTSGGGGRTEAPEPT